MSGRSGNRVFVGNLPPNVRERDIEDVFRKYGKITNLDLRSNKGPPFAFIDFDNSRDAEDAIHARDGYELDKYRLRVEFPRSYRDNTGRDGRGGGRYGDRNGRGGGEGGYGGFSRNGYGGDRRGGNMRRSKYRVLVTGLPTSGSWQDLKDHMREAGEVCYADVNKDGTGSVEFLRESDMKYAVKKLDDTKFKSHEGDHAYIRLKAAEYDRRSRSRSARSPGGRSRSRSPTTRAPRSSPKAKDDKEKKKSPDSTIKRERSTSASPTRSSRSKSDGKSKTPSRSPSRERERD